MNKIILLSDSLLFLLIKGIRILPPFFLLPILTSILPPADYGKYTLILLLINILVPIIGINSNAFLQVNFYKKANEFKKQYGTSIIAALILSLGLGIFLMIFSNLFEKFLAIDSSFIPLISTFVLLRIIHLNNLSYFQVVRHIFSFGVSDIFVSVFYLSLAIYFISYLKYNWSFLIYAHIISLFIINIYNLIKLYSNNAIKLTFKYEIFKDIYHYGLPLVPHTLSMYLFSSTDRFAINYFIGLTETGIYTVSVQLGLVVGLMFTSFNTAFIPSLFQELNSEIPNKRVIYKTLLKGLVSILFLSLVFYFIFPFLENLLVGEKYSKAYEYLHWILTCQFFMGVQMVLGNFLFYYGKTKLIAANSFVAFLLNLVLTIFLAEKFGVMGVAISSAISSLFYLISTGILSFNQLNKSLK